MSDDMTRKFGRDICTFYELTDAGACRCPACARASDAWLFLRGLLALIAATLPAIHYHACPRCYIAEACALSCCIEPDLERDGVPFGYYARCSKCNSSARVSQIADSLSHAENALAYAVIHGRRTDCLREAVRALQGALRNVQYEERDEERAQ